EAQGRGLPGGQVGILVSVPVEDAGARRRRVGAPIEVALEGGGGGAADLVVADVDNVEGGDNGWRRFDEVVPERGGVGPLDPDLTDPAAGEVGADTILADGVVADQGIALEQDVFGSSGLVGVPADDEAGAFVADHQ